MSTFKEKWKLRLQIMKILLQMAHIKILMFWNRVRMAINRFRMFLSNLYVLPLKLLLSISYFFACLFYGFSVLFRMQETYIRVSIANGVPIEYLENLQKDYQRVIFKGFLLVFVTFILIITLINEL